MRQRNTDTKKTTEQLIKANTQIIKSQRKQLQLQLRSEPVTKTTRIEKKILKQQSVLAKFNTPGQLGLFSVKAKHNQLQETFQMSQEDPFRNTEFLEFHRVYAANYSAWKQHFERTQSLALLMDNKKHELQKERKEFGANVELQKAHTKRLEPSLKLLSSSYSSSTVQSKKFGFTFQKKEKSFVDIITKTLVRFYFDTLVHEKKLIHTFPELVENKMELEMTHITNNSQNVCEVCQEPLLVEEVLGHTVCPKCSVVKQGGCGVGFKQSFIEAQSSNRGPATYNREHHLREFLQKLEAQERTDIPVAVRHAVLTRCKHMKINPLETPEKVTYNFVRTALKGRYAGYFENIPQIISLVTGKQPVTITEAQKAQKPFEECKKKRRNFLSYSYIVYKTCEILGYTQILPYLPLFKDHKNLQAADEIWRYICKRLNYEYIPTAL